MQDGVPAEKDSLGRMRYENISINDAANRINYRQADNRDYLDGDRMSVIDQSKWRLTNDAAMIDTTIVMYDYGRSSMISNNSRVVKGGSWRDGAYFF